MAAAVVQREYRKGKSKKDKRALTRAGVQKTEQLEARLSIAEADRLGQSETDADEGVVGALREQHTCSLVALAEMEEQLQAYAELAKAEAVADDVVVVADGEEDEVRDLVLGARCSVLPVLAPILRAPCPCACCMHAACQGSACLSTCCR